MDKHFWKDKKVLLTGHTGFKGSWLSLWLQHLGARVVGYALEPPSHPSMFELANISKGMVSIIGDVRDLKHLKAVHQAHEPHIVIHMAAQTLVRHSYDHPVETYDTNVMGTVNLLEAGRESEGLRAVIIVTSDKCYENREWVWGYRESDPMGGHDPYSSSKGCAELVTAAYRRSFFSNSEDNSSMAAVASVRAGNVIGGGDWAKDRLIPDMVKGFMAGEPVEIRYPGAIRPWQYVLEPLRGYMVLAEKLSQGGHRFAEGWNFGPRDEDAKPVAWVADRMVEYWGDNAGYKKGTAANPHEANYLKLDASKSRLRLEWEPRLNLDSVLESVVNWYKAFARGEDMHRISLEEIERYERLF